MEQRETQYRAPRENLNLSDFVIERHLGDGSLSAVVLAHRKGTDPEKKIAIKIVNKHVVMRNKMVEYLKNER